MVGLLPCVDAQVALQRLQVAKASPADLTGIWLLARVDEHVSAEMSNLQHTRRSASIEPVTSLTFSKCHFRFQEC